MLDLRDQRDPAEASGGEPSHDLHNGTIIYRLIAAIPATIFYNKFITEVNRQAQRMEGFADEFSSILSRQLDERGVH